MTDIARGAHGDLEATSRGQMPTAMTDVEGRRGAPSLTIT